MKLLVFVLTGLLLVISAWADIIEGTHISSTAYFDDFAISADGSRVVLFENYSRGTKIIKVYDTKLKEFVGTPFKTGHPYAIDLSRYGDKVLIKECPSHESWSVAFYSVYDVHSGRALFEYSLRNEGFCHLQHAMFLSPDEKKLILAGPRTLSIFDLKTRQETKIATEAQWEGVSGTFFDDHNFYLLEQRNDHNAGYDQRISQYDLNGVSSLRADLPFALRDGFKLSLSPDQKLLLSIRRDSRALIAPDNLQILTTIPYADSGLAPNLRGDQYVYYDSTYSKIGLVDPYSNSIDRKVVPTPVDSPHCHEDGKYVCYISKVFGAYNSNNEMIFTYKKIGEDKNYYPFKIGTPIVLDIHTGKVKHSFNLQGRLGLEEHGRMSDDRSTLVLPVLNANGVGDGFMVYRFSITK